MRSIQKSLFIIILACAPGTPTVAQKRPERTILSEELYKNHFTQYDVDGSIIIPDRTTGNEYVYGAGRIDKPCSPASTFKIFNSLAELDSGVITDTSYVIKWDSARRGR